jgi:hypothetical protein
VEKQEEEKKIVKIGNQIRQNNQERQEENQDEIPEEIKEYSQKHSAGNKEGKMFKHEIYDRLPFTYKGVDIFTKVMIGITIAFIFFAILVSNR